VNMWDLNEHLEKHRTEVTDWMVQKRSEVAIPIYGSVDVRDAGWKIGVVDANHFPAGFNNVSIEEGRELSVLFGEHLQRTHPGCSWVHIYPENHTRNPAYIENIASIKRIVEHAGYRCTVGSPELSEHAVLNGTSGPLELTQVTISKMDELLIDGASPDLILLNNDLTNGNIPGVASPNVTPPPHMGWFRRRKSQHYEALRPYVVEMADLLNIDPWHLMPDWIVSENKCLTEENCKQRLAVEIDEFLDQIRQRYTALGIDREPTVVMKNDSGTYGLGVMVLTSGDQILNLSNRKANRLRYAKGGAAVENFLIQEGIPTALMTEEEEPLEPVVYLVDGEAASWFYRINGKKSDMENLNSPSARFENYADTANPYAAEAHGWHALVAELSMLAMGKEAEHYIVEA